jgi:chromate transporter
VLRGPEGALVATAGIFLPAFVFVALSGPLIPKLRASKAAGAFLDGVNVASLALMAVVSFQLAQAALIDWKTVALTLATTLVLLRVKLNPTWLIAAGAMLGFALHP